MPSLVQPAVPWLPGRSGRSSSSSWKLTPRAAVRFLTAPSGTDTACQWRSRKKSGGAPSGDQRLPGPLSEPRGVARRSACACRLWCSPGSSRRSRRRNPPGGDRRGRRRPPRSCRRRSAGWFRARSAELQELLLARWNDGGVAAGAFAGARALSAWAGCSRRSSARGRRRPSSAAGARHPVLRRCERGRSRGTGGCRRVKSSREPRSLMAQPERNPCVAVETVSAAATAPGSQR